MATYTFLDLAVETLLASEIPLTVQKIWESSVDKGFTSRLRKTGQTPWATLGARLYVDIRDNPSSRFIKSAERPAKFSLKDPKAAQAALDKLKKALATEPEVIDVDSDGLPDAEGPAKTKKYPYLERELHPWLVHFAKYGLQGVYMKTIFHENSNKKGYAEWLHPDLVGFWFPFSDFSREVVELSGGNAIVRFFSVEMKRELTMATLRESFFQTVSNSSWAHEAYLAAANIDESEDFRTELGHLCGSFGIGVIELDIEQPEASSILFQARKRESVDWNGVNRLAKKNPDFKKFINDVQIDINAIKEHPSEYDACPSLEELASKREKWGLSS